jgi:hypothetical protein
VGCEQHIEAAGNEQYAAAAQQACAVRR